MSFYFGDMVGVRTPQGFGGCASRRRLRKRSNQKERPLYSQSRQIETVFLTAHTRWVTAPRILEGIPSRDCNARITRPLSNAHYGKIYCARYVFLKIGRNTISVLCGSVSYIACFTLLRRCHHVSNYSTSENGFRGRAHRQTLFHHPLFGRSRTTGAPQDALRKIGRNTPSGALLEI